MLNKIPDLYECQMGPCAYRSIHRLGVEGETPKSVKQSPQNGKNASRGKLA